MATKKKETKALAKPAAKGLTPNQLVDHAAKVAHQSLAMFAELFALTDAPVEVAVEAYHVLHKQMEKPIEDLRKAAREGLMTALDWGESRFTVNTHTYEVKLEQPVARTPDKASTAAVLSALGLDLEVGCDTEIVYKPSDEKLKKLLAEKKLTEAEYKACFKTPSPRLSVEKV